MNALLSFLPQAPGLLPKWQLFVAITALFNTVQNFVTTKLTRQIYDGVPPYAPVTPLQARTFGIWTLTSAVIRAYAAYNIETKAIYDMALISYLIAFVHFGSELLIYKSARPNRGSMSPVVVSTLSLVWMLSQYDWYIKS
ncbi:Erg28-like protein [Fistulina hepatica ATCC 64428]|nr:Erg28-like protein [Fistulina hepatica ATCC 64428]